MSLPPVRNAAARLRGTSDHLGFRECGTSSALRSRVRCKVSQDLTEDTAADDDTTQANESAPPETETTNPLETFLNKKRRQGPTPDGARFFPLKLDTPEREDGRAQLVCTPVKA